MGKKNRTNKDSKLAKSKHEEDSITSALLQKTSTLPASNAKEHWNEHVAIRELLEKLEKIQTQNNETEAKLPFNSEDVLSPKDESSAIKMFKYTWETEGEIRNRSDLLPNFSEWLKENGGDSQKVAVFATSDKECGVRALTGIQEGEQILSIPRKLILTSEYPSSTLLGSIIENDKLLRMMPNVVLALKLLHERYRQDSFWEPYIDILPRTFNTPLFFDQEEIRVLQGSQVLNNVFNLYKSIARQYAYLHQIFKKIPENSKLDFMKSFTFTEYRWAVSIVMTRQNQIPCSSGHGSDLALIPFLDMCNHSQGQITTDYDLSKDSCICFALHSCQPEDQVFIFYGPRSNSDFFLHSGFFYEENKHDLLHLQLGISKSDSLYTTKTQLMSKFSLDMKNIALNNETFPLTKELLAFLRIFCITEDEGNHLLEEPQETVTPLLFESSSQVSQENEEKIWSFLETRCSLILRQYHTTKEHDDAALEAQELSTNTQLAIKFLRSEKLLLLNAISFCKKTREQSKKTTQEK